MKRLFTTYSGLTILTLIFVLFAGSAWGATYYVDADASAGGNGSLATPWNDIADVNGGTAANDTVYFQRGDSWTLSSSLNVAGNGMTFGTYGTGAKPILSGAGSDDEVVDCQGYDNLAFENLDIRNGERIDHGCLRALSVAGLSIANCEISGGNYAGLDLSGSTNVVVTNPVISNCGALGIYLSNAASNVTIINPIISYIGQFVLVFNSGSTEPTVTETVTDATSGATGTIASYNLTAGTWAGGDAEGYIVLSGVDESGGAFAPSHDLNGSLAGANFATITSCYYFTAGIRCYGSGVSNITITAGDISEISDPRGYETSFAHGVGVRFDDGVGPATLNACKIHDTDGPGLVVNQVGGVIAKNNLFWNYAQAATNDTNKAAVRVTCQEDIHSFWFYNNTLYNGKVGVWINEENWDTEILITNNIFHTMSEHAISLESTDQAEFVTCIYNDAYNCQGASAYENITPGTGSITTNPQLLDASAGTAAGFMLEGNSPCRDEGYDLTGTVDDDYDGNARPQGSGYDIGAYELVQVYYYIGAGSSADFASMTAFNAAHDSGQPGDQFYLLGDIASFGTMSGNGTSEDPIVLKCNGYNIDGWSLTGNYWQLERCR